MTRAAVGLHQASIIMMRAFDSCLVAVADYTIDSRGDVGSGVREAAMDAMAEMLEADVTLLPVALLSAEQVHRAILALVQQVFEKIDRTRSVAGVALLRILFGPAGDAPYYSSLRAVFGDTKPVLDWTSSQMIFPVLLSSSWDSFALGVVVRGGFGCG